jgi:multicomponent Na+:H+ antiporter subunit A
VPGSLAAALAAAVAIPFAAALLLFAGSRLWTRASARSIPAGLAVASAATLTLLVAWSWYAAALPVHVRVDWMRTLGIGAGVYLDGLALIFVVVAAPAGLLACIYSGRFLAHERRSRGLSAADATYYGYLLLFLGAVLGVFVAEDLVQLYVFWELTDVASFLLIGLNWRDARSRAAAVKTGIITAIGGLALLVAFVILAEAAGTSSIPAILAAPPAGGGAVDVALVLLVIAAATKSAQFPFHGWLPAAMVAPTPVNAFVDSAAVLAAGVYLLARFLPVFAGAPLWEPLVTIVGLMSMVVGAVLAIGARDLKWILAYSTISQYGFIVALLGGASSAGVTAALFFFVHHAIIKAGLFFVAGLADYAGGDARARHVSLATAAALVLALSLAAVPPLGGFWMKEAFLDVVLGRTWPLPVLGFVVAALTPVYVLRFLTRAYAGRTIDTMAPVRLPGSMLAPALTLSVVTMSLGLWPEAALVGLVQPGASAVTGGLDPLSLSLHLGPALLLSIGALTLGAVLFVTRHRWIGVLALGPAWSVDRLWAMAATLLTAVGRRVLRTQHGLLSGYASVVLLGLLALVVFSLATARAATVPAEVRVAWNSGEAPLGLFVILVATACVLSFTLRRHLQVVLVLGAAGFLIAGVFAVARAPSLGLVQVHVETLITVLLLLGLSRIPTEARERLDSGPRARMTALRLIAAAVAGAAAAWVSWLAIEHRGDRAVADWIERHAETSGAADPVATVLLYVRALDTLGEVFVFGATTAGVLVLVRLVRGRAG